MKQISDLNIPGTFVKRVDGFDSLIGEVRDGEGSLIRSENVSCERFPYLYPRKKRVVLGRYGRITAICPDGEAARIEDGLLTVGDTAVEGEYFSEYFKHELLRIGNYITVMPDGFYCNLDDLTDRGTIGRSTYVGTVGAAVMTVDGELNEITDYTVLATRPTGALDGDFWAKPKDEGGYEMMVYEGHAWYPYESYVRLSVGSFAEKCRAGDVLECTGADRAIGKYIKVAFTDETNIYFEGAAPIVEKIENFTLKRPMPLLQQITVASGRAVGAYCGYDRDGRFVSKVYASAFGDPVCWSEYGGALSVDVGGSEPFTAIVEYRGDVLAFRERSIVRIKINDNKMTFSELKCEGITEGEERSAVYVDGCVYYKGASGIWEYDGGIPKRISASLGVSVPYSRRSEVSDGEAMGEVSPDGSDEYPQMPVYYAPAGGQNGCYYVALKGKDGHSHVYVYNPALKVWCLEDDPGVTGFIEKDGSLIAVCEDGDGSSLILWDADGLTDGITDCFVKSGELMPEDKVSWSLETGRSYVDVKNGAFPIRIFLRARLKSGAMVNVGCVYNDEALPRSVISISDRRDGYFEIPMPLTECESVRLYAFGKGEAEISGYDIEYRRKK